MSFLDRLPEPWRGRLERMGTEEQVAAGEVLMRHGEPGGDVFLCLEGELVVVDRRVRPHQVVVALGPGEVFGELGYIDRHPRAMEVAARTASRLVRWRHERLAEESHADPAFGRALYEALAQVAAARVRVLDAIVGSRQPATGASDVDPAADEQATTFDLAWSASDDGSLRAWLRSCAEVLAPVAGTDQGEALGSALRQRIGHRLELARTSAMLQRRAIGEPASPELWSHLVGRVPRGGTPEGERLDQALLDLPSLRAPAERAATLLRHLDEERLGQGDVVGLLAPGRTDLARALERRLEGCGALLRVLGERGDALVDVDALLALGRGTPPAELPALRALVIDGVPDILPDRLLSGLFRLASQVLQPDGLLLVGHTTSAWDQPLVDHLLRWPLLARLPRSLGPLLPDDGSVAPVQVLEVERAPSAPPREPGEPPTAGAVLATRRRERP